MQRNWIFLALLALLVALPLIQAATTATTLFVWNVPIAITRSYSVTYARSCSASNFYYNEFDANFDPDADGNAAKVPPSSNYIVRDKDTNTIDVNYNGSFTNSDRNIVAEGTVNTFPPTLGLPSEIISTSQYSNIKNSDETYEAFGTTTNKHSVIRMIFRVDPYPRRIQSLTLHILFHSFDQASAVSDCNDPIGLDLGVDKNTDVLVWNNQTSSYDYVGTDLNVGGVTMSSWYLTYQSHDFNLSRASIGDTLDKYIAPDGNVVFITFAAPPTSGAACVLVDEARLLVNTYPDSNNVCQTPTIAPITIANTGNVDINIDGNFTSAFSGVDLNLALKVWQGTGTGCGAGGFGGWEKDCSVTAPLSPVTATTCRVFNQLNATTNARLATKVLQGDSSQFCFSGDFNVNVSAGTHTKPFQVNDFNS